MDVEANDERPMDKKGKNITLENLKFEQVRKWVLSCFDGVEEWEEKHKKYLDEQLRASSGRGAWSKVKPIGFIPWLRQQLEKDKMSTLKRLVDGPSFKVVSYKGYRVNGHVIYTKDLESCKTTQNSGVKIKVMTNFRSSSRDQNLVHEKATYYGVVGVIIELDYYDFKQTVFYHDGNEYELPLAAKDQVLIGVNIAWKNKRCELRKVYDKYPADDARKRNCLARTIQEDWERFVNLSFDPKVVTMIARNKRSEDPETAKIDYFLAGHTCSNGSFLTPFLKAKVAEIKSIVEKNLEFKHFDVDDDPVGQAYGPEKKGRVRGDGILVIKSMLKHMKHARTIIKGVRLAYKEINNKLNVVKVRECKMQVHITPQRNKGGFGAVARDNAGIIHGAAAGSIKPMETNRLADSLADLQPPTEYMDISPCSLS
ncbi:hypothetical protein GIB67_031420 [Kingdonia uniflora]|uniref:Transposase n=1 Tax=Kingdonia uniflora TaxID=39325 RepID=A0A7J7MBG8_9MAGN|nr:hypothetical protein GIB67_031420 [Kingdonia uniflora]